MKKRCLLLLTLMLLFSLTACGGQVADGLILESAESELYTDEEINGAAAAVINYFQKNFRGCTMTALRFSEDASSREGFPWAEDYDAEKGIGFYSEFTTSDAADPSLEPNETYSAWQWYVALMDNGQWTVVNYGLG